MLTTPPQDLPQPGQTLMNAGENYQKNQNFTFKIIKRRAPWNKKEDEAIIELVNKYGTSNWTIIANEMALLYKSKHRNGKQCRERWHNHLDPIVNKENWTEEEENILFNKHLEYGNKWSDISKFLPGRTDNSIKNHFYSKLRKFIRKILKQINKENLLKKILFPNFLLLLLFLLCISLIFWLLVFSILYEIVGRGAIPGLIKLAVLFIILLSSLMPKILPFWFFSVEMIKSKIVSLVTFL
jgi:hypothetical protein